MSQTQYVEYHYPAAKIPHTDTYLAEPVLDILKSRPDIERVLDVGCGNGHFASRMLSAGYDVRGIDLSESGIEEANKKNEGNRFRVASVYDDLTELFDEPFDAVVSLEVVEHLYDPRTYIRRCREVLKPGGTFIISTPYHGYLKNLALALFGKFDAHHTPLWDGGHIKFWSRNTLTRLLEESGFEVTGFRGAGRYPYLWKSMVLTARKG